MDVLWSAFFVLILVCGIIDWVLVGRATKKDVILTTCVATGSWISIVIVFGFLILWKYDGKVCLEFFTGYLLEYSLSIDNLFVFILVFSVLRVTGNARRKVLMIGIVCAVIMRLIFISGGLELVENFHFLEYMFGIILIASAIKMILETGSKKELESSRIFQFLKRKFPIKFVANARGIYFFENGKLYFTQLFFAIILIELADLMFAFDSVPAVLSISHNKMVVYTSNIFAIIGLRSMFVLIEHAACNFKYLKHGVCLILIFVGCKMLINNFFHISVSVSICVILSIFCGSLLLSRAKLK